MTGSAAAPVTAPPSGRRLSPAVQYALLAGPLLSMLDSSIVNVAIEPMARELHASLPVMQWAVSGYLLALGTGLAATAYLSRRFGALPVYRVSVIAFTLASASCAAAPDVQVLLAGRIVQAGGPGADDPRARRGRLAGPGRVDQRDLSAQAGRHVGAGAAHDPGACHHQPHAIPPAGTLSAGRRPGCGGRKRDRCGARSQGGGRRPPV